MKILLDTHAFLWFIEDSPKLSTEARSAIEDGFNEPLLSVASLWEMAIKVSVGRLDLKKPFETFVPDQLELNGFDQLAISFQHIAVVAKLPFHHRDPFDRLLLAQAIAEGLAVVTTDRIFGEYLPTALVV